MNIVVLDGYTLNPGDNPWDPLAKLGELTVYDRTLPEQILERSLEAEVIITNKVRLNADTLAALPNLRCIGVIATGYDVVDIAAAGKRGIPVMNVVNYGTEAVAQHAFALLLEMVPGDLAAQITASVAIPTVGIGAGAGCDAQVLVWQDMAGLRTGRLPRFVKPYADMHRLLSDAASQFAKEVASGEFPGQEHTF